MNLWAGEGDIEQAALRVLERGVFDYYAGGADDEVTLARNVAAWRALRLRPHVLRDVSRVETATEILGTRLRTPVLVAPTALHRLAHPAGEVATARGAAAAGSLYVVSTRASIPFDEIGAAAPDAPRWFQVYVLRDRAWTEELVRRAVAMGCSALVLTGDTPLLGYRRRDARNRFRIPPDLARANLGALVGDDTAGELRQDPTITLDDIAWLRDLASLPVLVKGVVRPDDAVTCVEAGAAGIVVSNHGGRQLDHVVASADALPEVAAAVGDRAEVYVDGGIRRGTDVLKALALGARAVMVGRPVLWGLAAGGPEGVHAVLEGLRTELALAMALCGAPSLAALTPDLVA